MAIDKGTRVRVTSGKSEGVTGTVFWKGANKYGPGDRFGVRGDDGQTHWIDGTEVEEHDAPPPEAPTFDRGDRVRFKVDGREGTGTVFWTGESRHSPGQRLGVNPDDAEDREDAVWVDALACAPLSADDDPGPPAPRPSNPYQDRPAALPQQRRASSRPAPVAQDDDLAEIPADYTSAVDMDEVPAAPFDDSAYDQWAASAEDDGDDAPPTDW